MTTKDDAILDWQRRLAAMIDERDELRAEVAFWKQRTQVEEETVGNLVAEVERLQAALRELRTAMDATPRMMTERQVKAALDVLLDRPKE